MESCSNQLAGTLFAAVREGHGFSRAVKAR
jgi:hypothetical protein